MKGIIFDCDGTLVDSEMMHYQTWSRALKKHGVDFKLEDYCPFVGTSIDVTAHGLAGKIGKVCAQELKAEKRTFFRALINKGVQPIEDTLAFLHQLVKEQKQFGYKLGVASGAPREEISVYLRHLQIEHYFDVVLSGRDDLGHYTDPEGVNKPKPYIYQEAAKRLGLAVNECIAIEDSHIGVTASAKAGCITVAIPTIYSRQHDFSAAHWVLSSLKHYSSVPQFLDEAVKKYRSSKTAR